MNWRSLEFRLACLCSLLLLGGFASLGAVLWWGVTYNMGAAVDRLLEARAASLTQFMESEFGNVFAASRIDNNAGEFRGSIEIVSSKHDWIAMRGTKILLTAATEFEGSLRPAGLRPGQFGEVEVSRTGTEAPWTARAVAIVNDLPKEIIEVMQEYAATAAEGRLMRLWRADGEVILSGMDLKTALPREFAPAGFSTIETADGPYRTLHRQFSVAGQEYRLLLSSSLEALSATRQGLLRWSWWAVPTMVLLSLGGGYLISRSALRPLESFVAVANRLRAHHLSERLQRSRNGDVIDRLANTFNSLLDRLEVSIQKLDQFTADASHELRSPVAVIRTTAELALRQDRKGQDLRNDVGQIQAEAVRLTDLIEDLLTLARADDPQHAPLTTAVAIRPILEELGSLFSHQAGSHVRFETPASACFVRGDVSSLRRLLVILVENALRHNPDDTSVVISARKENGCLRVSVTDTGQGIPAHELPKVFDRFYRGDPSRSQANGHGLGLSIAKWIAQCHGTEITVASTIGEGSTFSFSLALCDAP